MQVLQCEGSPCCQVLREHSARRGTWTGPWRSALQVRPAPASDILKGHPPSPEQPSLCGMLHGVLCKLIWVVHWPPVADLEQSTTSA